MERLKNKKLTLPVAALGGVAIGVGVVLGVQVAERSDSTGKAVHAFEQTYTYPGKCLHDTPYDPATGAFIDLRYDPQSGEEILSDMPHAANSYEPSVLLLAVNQWDEFRPADQTTEAFLGKVLCPVLPQT